MMRCVVLIFSIAFCVWILCTQITLTIHQKQIEQLQKQVEEVLDAED